QANFSKVLKIFLLVRNIDYISYKINNENDKMPSIEENITKQFCSFHSGKLCALNKIIYRGSRSCGAFLSIKPIEDAVFSKV
ncbi:MAG: hypothetical protein ACOCPM_00700, partial [Bacteroidales bacterium]